VPSFVRNFRYTYFAEGVKIEILLILLHLPRALYHFNIECEKMRIVHKICILLSTLRKNKFVMFPLRKQLIFKKISYSIKDCIFTYMMISR